MSGEAIGWAFRKVQMDDPTTKLVLVALCNHANHEDQAWPANSVLCQTTGLSKRAVQNSLKKLEYWGLITRVRRSREDGSDTSCMVYIDLECGWIVKNGEARRAPGALNARLGVQEVQGGGAPYAPLETTSNPQVNNIMGDEYFSVEPKSQPPAESKPTASAKKRRCTIPPEFPLTDRLKKYATDRGVAATYVATLFDNFKNYHLAKGTVMLDWDAAWRTWVGNESRFNGHRSPPNRPAPRAGMVYGDDYM